MKYRKDEAKDYSRARMRGIFAAANTPFREGDLALDEAGLRRNLRHWVDDLGIDGVFVAGKQGEFFSMSVAERKRTFEIAVEEIGGKARTIMSCSDQNMDVVIELARHAQAIGARLHRGARAGAALPAQAGRDALRVLPLHQRAGRHRHRAVEPSGLRLSDEPGAVRADRRIAEHRRDQVQRAARDVRAADAARRRQDPGLAPRPRTEWFDNIVELGWRLYLCSSPPYTLQTKVDRRMREYTDLAVRAARWRKRQGGARQPQSGARGVPPHAAGRRSPMRIRNTGRSCSARSAARCAGRCWN